MDAKDYKELKKALWEIEMKKEGRDIPYLEYQDILEIVQELKKDPGNKLTLSQEAYSFYKKDFDKVQNYLDEVEKEEQKVKAMDFRAQVEKDKERAIQIMIRQNSNIPWQVRKSEQQIRQEVKQAVGEPFTHDLSYRRTLAKLCGGELASDWNTVKLDKRNLDERMIQENFNKQQAEKKAKAAEENEKPIL